MDGIPCSPREHQANRRTEIKVTGISKTEANSDYDMSKFANDEEIPAYLLDQDFFKDCLQDRRLSKTKTTTDITNATKPVENKVQPLSKTPVKETKQTKDVTPAKENKPVDAVKPVVAENKAKKAEPVVVKKEAKEPVQTKEPVQAKEPVATNASSVTYRVQIFALTREKSLVDSEFDGLIDLQMYIEDGMYKYTTGVFDTHEEALQYRAEMVRNGFNDAFVVTFANGKRIYVSPSY
jgi:hypothetical protein